MATSHNVPRIIILGPLLIRGYSLVLATLERGMRKSYPDMITEIVKMSRESRFGR